MNIKTTYSSKNRYEYLYMKYFNVFRNNVNGRTKALFINRKP